MNVSGKHYRTIWPIKSEPGAVEIIDQRELPHRFVTLKLRSLDDYVEAISDMAVRGAGLIGATAAYGISCAAYDAPDDLGGFEAAISNAAQRLINTRPTAKNLEWAVGNQLDVIAAVSSGTESRELSLSSGGRRPASRPQTDIEAKREAALRNAAVIADGDADACREIGKHGLALIQAVYDEKCAAGRKNEAVHILTHCNAGWLAFVDYGSATAPIYAAHDEGIPVHVWVDETRPRAQGAALTAWELGSHGVSHDVIVDNAGGHLMQHGLVDLVITGADRVTVGGDAANKIGTYLKALAARDNDVPFYIALPSSTFDWDIDNGLREIPIEERSPDEVRYARGLSKRTGEIDEVLLCPEFSTARNWGFDVTPRQLISSLITERGICPASREGIVSLFPDAGGRAGGK